MTVKTVVVLCISAAMLVAQPLSRGERDRAMSHLHATRKMLLDEVTCRAQWRFKPVPGMVGGGVCRAHCRQRGLSRC
jgi:hypothetical protein